LNAYVFNKSDRAIFNFVNEIKVATPSELRSDTETFILGENDDFIITDVNFNIGDTVPQGMINKAIITEQEKMQKTQADLIYELMSKGVL
jgi:hypothetical protein